MQVALEHGTPAQRRALVDAILAAGVCELACDARGTFCVQAAMKHTKHMEEQREQIEDAIAACEDELKKDKYGHFVFSRRGKRKPKAEAFRRQDILAGIIGSDEQRQEIVNDLVSDIGRHSVGKFESFVVQGAFQHGTFAQRRQLVDALLTCDDGAWSIAKNKFVMFLS